MLNYLAVVYMERNVSLNQKKKVLTSQITSPLRSMFCACPSTAQSREVSFTSSRKVSSSESSDLVDQTRFQIQSFEVDNKTRSRKTVPLHLL